MICPLKFNVNDPNHYCKVIWGCEGKDCQAWEPKAKYNPETKEYEGDCRLFMLERKISGLITTHPG